MPNRNSQHELGGPMTGESRGPLSHNPPAGDQIDQDEQDRALYAAVRRDGISTRKVAAHLGWSKRRAERIRQQLLRYKHAHPMPKEQAVGNMRPGRETWLFYPQFPGVTEELTTGCLQEPETGHRMKLMSKDFAAQINAANKRLDELIAESTAGDKQIRDLEAASAKADAAATVEKEEAYIAGRAENESILRAAAVATKKLAELRSRVAIVDGAILRQKTFIAETHAAALANRDSGFLEELAKLRLREKLLRQAAEIAATVNEIGLLSAKHNVCGFLLLNPTPYYSYPDTRAAHYCDALNLLIGAAWGFGQVQSQQQDRAA